MKVVKRNEGSVRVGRIVGYGRPDSLNGVERIERATLAAAWLSKGMTKRRVGV